MDAFFARGREALKEHYRVQKIDRYISPDLAIVTREDFVACASSMLLFASVDRSIYILDENGALAALLCRHGVPT